MIVCIAGSRGYTGCLSLVLNNSIGASEFIHGGCKNSPDMLAIKASRYLGVKCTEFKADWDKHGKYAGPKRNKEMAEYADILICFHDGSSRGAKNCMHEFKSIGKKVLVYNLNTEEYIKLLERDIMIYSEAIVNLGVNINDAFMYSDSWIESMKTAQNEERIPISNLYRDMKLEPFRDYSADRVAWEKIRIKCEIGDYSHIWGAY